ncbi:PhzF family phenazine biosynthesis protein [Haemophilus parahaemolyticus]
MSRQYAFKLVNVFAEEYFGGNPLAVFPDAEGLTEQEMQQIAKQFNLSETVFVLPSKSVVADLRIFTPYYELPLAGHPTIGAACVLQKLRNLPEQFSLNTKAKTIEIQAKNQRAEMAIRGFDIKTSSASLQELAEITGLGTQEIASQAYWLNSGSPHLFLQLLNKNALAEVQINVKLLDQLCHREQQRSVMYLWYEENETVYSRLFYTDNGTVIEDSGTGSACANLGAYYLSLNQYPLQRQIFQGDYMGRPNRLYLKLDQQQTIYVGGQVIEVGEGQFSLP